MKIYYEKQKFLAIFLKFMAILATFSTLSLIMMVILQSYKYIDYYLEYQQSIQLAAIISSVLLVFFIITYNIVKKRKNIRFDGKTIQFCINNYVESEFDLRKLDELFKYRSIKNIKYGYQDALAFRFHKNDVWESIDSSYTNLKTNEKSIVLLNDINQAYAYIKSQRVIKQISPSQGVRFRYLVLESVNASKEDYDNALKEFENTFSKYTNTYGGFNLDRLVITSDSLYYNRDKVASTKSGCYVSISKINEDNKKYLFSEIINFLNKNNELIISIDTTRVVNNELFKTLVLSVFTLKEIDDLDIIVKSNKVSVSDNENSEDLIDGEKIETLDFDEKN